MAAAILGLAAVLASLSFQVAQAETGDAFLSAINETRKQGVTCPEVNYQGGEVDPPMQMDPASPLKRNATLDAAAREYAAAVAAGTAWIQQEPLFVGPSGYLPWRSAAYYYKRTALDETRAAADSRSDFGCRSVFSNEYSEIGTATASDGTWTTFLYIVAEPFDPARVPEYTRRIFDDINRIRAQGATCFGRIYGPKPAFIWSDGLALAAQEHSEDMATMPFAGGDPHAGSDGSRPQQRVDRVPCANSGVAENVAFNSSPLPGQAWIDMSPGHCGNVMSDRVHAGLGVSTAPALAGSMFGRNPYVTLDVATASGACAPGASPDPVKPPVTGNPVKPPDSTPAYGVFELDANLPHQQPRSFRQVARRRSDGSERGRGSGRDCTATQLLRADVAAARHFQFWRIRAHEHELPRRRAGDDVHLRESTGSAASLVR